MKYAQNWTWHKIFEIRKKMKLALNFEIEQKMKLAQNFEIEQKIKLVSFVRNFVFWDKMSIFDQYFMC